MFEFVLKCRVGILCRDENGPYFSMATNKLTDAGIRAAKPREKKYKLYDGGGLHIAVMPSGSKLWRLDYRVNGRPKQASFGPYPKTALKDARAQRDSFQAADTGMTLQDASARYWRAREASLSRDYLMNARNALDAYVMPALGARQVGSITRADLMAVLEPINDAGKYVYVRKVLMWLGQVFDWCVEFEYCEANPCRSIKPDRAFGSRPVEHFPCVELAEAHDLMARIAIEGELLSVTMAQLLALTWVRTKELRFAEWSEFDGDTWRVPKERMKSRRDHLVPLSGQAVAVLDRWRERSDGKGLLFPGPRGTNRKGLPRPASENAVTAMLDRIGYKGKMTGHGFRSLGSTWAYEREHEYRSEVIEMQLAHVERNKVKAAYNRAKFLVQRRQMLQDYADWLMPDS